MSHKKLSAGLALLVLLLAAVLGGTVLREPIALAATPFQNVIVGNTDSQPLPVNQLPVTNGGGAQFDPSDTESTKLATPATASEMIVRFLHGGGGVVIFSYQGNEVLRVPNEGGLTEGDPGAFVHVPLTRPVKFDEMRCTLVDCVAFYAGATP